MAYNSYWNENWEEPWQNLLYYMQLRNISFQQLAERSGVKQSTIEGWRRDKMMMLHAWAESVVRVCDVLQVQPSYMLGLAADPKRAREEIYQLGLSPEARVLKAVSGLESSTSDEADLRIKRKKRVENKPGKKRSEDK